VFAVLYRWRLKAGSEETFRQAWARATTAIRARYGTSGSRLHRADDGSFVAYAVWPDRAAWELAQSQPSAAPEEGAIMKACAEEFLGATPLAIVEDMLVAPRA
jgi:quinol monooxygenase YgiN